MSNVPGMGAGMQDDMMLDYLLEMGALTPEQEQVMRQRSMVDQLRASSQVPTDTRNAGRAQVARHPLEMLAPVVGQGIASWKEKKADTAAKALQDKKLAGIQGMRSRWAIGKQPPTGATTPNAGAAVGDIGYGYDSPL
jgi:hypothetical protein